MFDNIVTKRHGFVRQHVRPIVNHAHVQGIVGHAQGISRKAQARGVQPWIPPVAACVAMLSMGLVLTAHTQHSFRVFADEKRVVRLYVDGKERTVVSSAATVSEILQENGITIQSGDVIEPEAQTVVDQPNYNINVYRAAPAVVEDSGRFLQVVTGYRSARKIAAAAGVTLYPEDLADVEQVQDFGSTRTLGYKVKVSRATPVQLILAGETVNVRTRAATVGDLLKEKQVEFTPSDLQGVAPETKLTSGLRVVVSKTSQETLVAVEDIKPGTQTIIDANLDAGKTQTKREGVAGRKQVTYLIEKINGAESRRTVLNEQILTAAIDAVVIRGTRPVARSGGQPSPEQWAKLRFCEAGGNYANKRNPLYRGAYQFDYRTWNNFGGYYDPADAPPEVQDAAAFALYARRGAQPWPVCGRFLR